MTDTIFDLYPLDFDMMDAYAAVSNPPAFLKGTLATELAGDQHPSINQTDIARGYITRYFARQINHTLAVDITEVSVQIYNYLTSIPLFSTVQMLWKISGGIDDIISLTIDVAPVRLYTGVKTANIMSIQLADAKMPGMILKLNDPLQYYQGA